MSKASVIIKDFTETNESFKNKLQRRRCLMKAYNKTLLWNGDSTTTNFQYRFLLLPQCWYVLSHLIYWSRREILLQRHPAAKPGVDLAVTESLPNAVVGICSIPCHSPSKTCRVSCNHDSCSISAQGLGVMLCKCTRGIYVPPLAFLVSHIAIDQEDNPNSRNFIT